MTLRTLALPLALGGALVLMVGCGDSSGKTVDDPEVKYTRQSMIDACLRMHACGVFQLTAVHNCIQNYDTRDVIPQGKEALYKHLHQCVNKGKGDCKAIRECFGNKASDLACDGKYTDVCDGDVRRFCDLLDKRIYRIDCNKGGLKCSLDSQGAAFCGAGPCESNGKTIKKECQNNNTQMVYCQGQGLMIKQCDWKNLTCGLDRDKNLDCVGTGKECKG